MSYTSGSLPHITALAVSDPVGSVIRCTCHHYGVAHPFRYPLCSLLSFHGQSQALLCFPCLSCFITAVSDSTLGSVWLFTYSVPAPMQRKEAGEKHNPNAFSEIHDHTWDLKAAWQSLFHCSTWLFHTSSLSETSTPSSPSWCLAEELCLFLP